MIIFWKLKHNNTIKTGWCHDQPLESCIEAILYQSGITLAELTKDCATVKFIYRNAVPLGSYHFENGEFYPSSEYDDNPTMAHL